MVKHFFSTVETGYYAGAEMIGKIVLYLPSTIVILMFPKVASLNTQNKDPRPILIKACLLLLQFALVLHFVILLFQSL